MIIAGGQEPNGEPGEYTCPNCGAEITESNPIDFSSSLGKFTSWKYYCESCDWESDVLEGPTIVAEMSETKDKETKTRINETVRLLRVLAVEIGKHQVLFPGVEIVDKTELCAMLLGGSDPDSGNTLEVSRLLRYIADMMEV